MRVLAVDLGATSVRVGAVNFDAHQPTVQIMHRWEHGPVRHNDGSLRWDWDGIVREVQRGLKKGHRSGPVDSIGIDGWAVDYGLLDDHGKLLSQPLSYRDDRTAGWYRTVEQIGARKLYEVTGIQLMQINTIFQLVAHDRSELRAAGRLMLLPDLLAYQLTKDESMPHTGTEHSNATTTALVDHQTGQWSTELLDAIDVRHSLFGEISPAGTYVGTWCGTPVYTVGSHDTASAFAAVPGQPTETTGIVSSGTWVLVGVERVAADTSEQAMAANFSNEGGALSGVRFLKNVMGFWMLEQCRESWGSPPIEELVAEAADAEDGLPIVDAADPRFLAPSDMEAEVKTAARLPESVPRAGVVRVILESIADTVADTVDELGTILGRPIDKLFVVGGGTRIAFMNELLFARTGLPVTVGSHEATALGNAVVQGIALGKFPDLSAARSRLTTAATTID